MNSKETLVSTLFSLEILQTPYPAGNYNHPVIAKSKDTV